MTRQTVNYGSNADLSRDLRFTESASRGTSLRRRFSATAGRSPRSRCRIRILQVTVAEIDLRFLQDFFGDTEVGKTGFAYIVDSKGQVLASSSKGPEIGKDVSSLPQVAAISGSLLSEGRTCRQRRADDGERGAAHRLVRVLRAADGAGADADPRAIAAHRAV